MLTKQDFDAIEEHTGVIKGIIIKEFAKALCYGGSGIKPMLVKEDDVSVEVDNGTGMVNVGIEDTPLDDEEVTRSLKIILKDAGYPTVEYGKERFIDNRYSLAQIKPEIVCARMLIDKYSAF